MQRSLYDNYIKPALDVSCTPILCTPIVRRTATGEWTKQELHITDDAAQFKGGIIHRQSVTLQETLESSALI